jgi:polysaccharide export outer membrane protein
MRRILMRRIIVFSVAILLAGVGITQAAQQDKKDARKGTAVASARDTTTPDTEGKAAPSAATTDPAYVIGPEDVLDINVWKEPDVSRVVPVRPDGRISLPLINDVQAAGLSPQQLAGNVTEKLRKYLNEPQVTVIVTAINSQPDQNIKLEPGDTVVVP